MKEYILKFVDPQITISEEAKKDFKKLMGWNEKQFMEKVFVRLSGKDKLNPKRKRLKDYEIKTKIELIEVRERYKQGGVYEQPFKCYALRIHTPNCMTQKGGLKNGQEVLKKLKEEFYW